MSTQTPVTSSSLLCIPDLASTNATAMSTDGRYHDSTSIAVHRYTQPDEHLSQSKKRLRMINKSDDVRMLLGRNRRNEWRDAHDGKSTRTTSISLPIPNLRRQVASAWTVGGSITLLVDHVKVGRHHRPAPNTIQMLWSEITLFPPTTGPYDYDEWWAQRLSPGDDDTDPLLSSNHSSEFTATSWHHDPFCVAGNGGNPWNHDVEHNCCTTTYTAITTCSCSSKHIFNGDTITGRPGNNMSRVDHLDHVNGDDENDVDIEQELQALSLHYRDINLEQGGDMNREEQPGHDDVYTDGRSTCLVTPSPVPFVEPTCDASGLPLSRLTPPTSMKTTPPSPLLFNNNNNCSSSSLIMSPPMLIKAPPHLMFEGLTSGIANDNIQHPNNIARPSTSLLLFGRSGNVDQDDDERPAAMITKQYVASKIRGTSSSSDYRMLTASQTPAPFHNREQPSPPTKQQHQQQQQQQQRRTSMENVTRDLFPAQLKLTPKGHLQEGYLGPAHGDDALVVHKKTFHHSNESTKAMNATQPDVITVYKKSKRGTVSGLDPVQPYPSQQPSSHVPWLPDQLRSVSSEPYSQQRHIFLWSTHHQQQQNQDNDEHHNLERLIVNSSNTNNHTGGSIGLQEDHPLVLAHQSGMKASAFAPGQPSRRRWKSCHAGAPSLSSPLSSSSSSRTTGGHHPVTDSSTLSSTKAQVTTTPTTTTTATILQQRLPYCRYHKHDSPPA